MNIARVLNNICISIFILTTISCKKDDDKAMDDLKIPYLISTCNIGFYDPYNGNSLLDSFSVVYNPNVSNIDSIASGCSWNNSFFYMHVKKTFSNGTASLYFGSGDMMSVYPDTFQYYAPYEYEISNSNLGPDTYYNGNLLTIIISKVFNAPPVFTDSTTYFSGRCFGYWTSGNSTIFVNAEFKNVILNKIP